MNVGGLFLGYLLTSSGFGWTFLILLWLVLIFFCLGICGSGQILEGL